MAQGRQLISLTRADVEQACRQRVREIAASLGMTTPDLLTFEQVGRVSFQDNAEHEVPLFSAVVAWDK